MIHQCCLRIRNLNFEREKNGVFFSLHVPALDLLQGKILAVVGESGCGKSTLSDLIALILRPNICDQFCFYKEDETVDLMSASTGKLASIRGHDIGYVLQSGGLFPFLNVLENIMLPGKLIGLSNASLRQKAEDLASKIGISEQLYKKPQHLSGGQRQRVAIARALIHSPRLVIADEPTAAVDEYTANEICEVFKKAVSMSNSSLLIVSHDRALMHKHADYEVTFRLTKDYKIKSQLCEPVLLNG